MSYGPVEGPIIRAHEQLPPSLAVRCKKHPAYRAVFKPRVRCRGCWYLWRYTQ